MVVCVVSSYQLSFICVMCLCVRLWLAVFSYSSFLVTAYISLSKTIIKVL